MGIREDNEGVAAWLAMVQSHAVLLEALERDLTAAHNLPLTWFEVLMRLVEAPQGMVQMQDLVETAWLSKSGVTRLVDRMAAAGLVDRQACASDRRVTYARITPAGRRALTAAIPTHVADVEREFAQHLTVEEQRVLRQLLTKVLQAHGRVPETCGAVEQASDAETA